MSDYEGDGWEPVSSSTYRPTRSSDVFVTKAVPKEPASGVRTRLAPRNRPIKPRRRICVDSDFHPKIQQIQPKSFSGLQFDHPTVGPAPNANPNSAASSERSMRSHGPSDQEYVMSKSWSEVLKQTAASKEAAIGVFRRLFRDISNSSGAHLEIPVKDTNRLPVWGNHEQCKLAIAQLDAWYMSSQTQARKGKDVMWQKSYAYDGRKEHRNMQESFTQYTNQLFQDADDDDFGFEAYLIWPADYDLNTYLKLNESTTIQEMSINFRCRFHHEKKGKGRYTRIRAQAEQDLLAAYQRLLGMVREMITRKSQGLYGNFFLMPKREDYREDTVIRKSASGKTFTFAMIGDSSKEAPELEWHKLAQHVDSQARRAVERTLSTFVHNLHMSQSYVRIRVDFGQLELKSFQKPQHNSNKYHTDDFLIMIGNPRTELSECNLQTNQGDMFRLVEMFKAMPVFYQLEETFKVMCDFQNASKASLIRLETELERGYDAGESQIRAQRWVNLHSGLDSATMLNLKVLDMNKPSFAIRGTRYDLMSESQVTKDMKIFQGIHKFSPDPNGINAFPRRRSTIPPHQRDLKTVTEVTSVKMRVRNMEGTVELQREDIYEHRGGKDSLWPTSSRWWISYYYLGWDTHLDELGNIQPGEEVSWSKTLSTFFPEHAAEDEVVPLPQGFKKFWEEIKLIQGYAAEAISHLSASEEL